MATFAYRARDNTGRIVSGTLEADSDRTAVATLRDRGFMVTSLERQEKEAGPSQPISFFGGKINRQDVVLFTRQLATMVAAGLPLVTSLEVLSQQTSSRRLKEVIQSVRRGIEAGGTLSGEMAKHPKVFSELYVNTVRSGEVSGALDSIAEYLASYMEAEMDLSARIKTAATYPGVVIGASLTVGVVAIKFVLPTFVSLLVT
ncbi:MAG: type II secretion system F family protein, partial [Armatimonadetes bacterium]|nr:type II secretion system F family protein [Armatimonadota bacterium]